MSIRTGSHAYIGYGKEAIGSFKTPATINRALGLNQKISGIEVNQNPLKVSELNSRIYSPPGWGQFGGSFTLEWILSNPWWLDLLYQTPSFSAGTPNTHVYPNQSTYPNTVPKDLNSFTVENGIDATPDIVRKFAGCIFTGAVSLSSRINEFARVRAPVGFAKEVVPIGTSLLGSIPTDDINFPYTFVHGTITVADISVATVQAIEINQNPQSAFDFGHNAYEADDFHSGLMDISGRITAKFHTKEHLQLTIDRQEPTTNTMVLKYTNGGAGNAEKSLQFDGTGIELGVHTVPDESPGEPIMQDITYSVRIPKWTAKNALSAPA